VAPDAALTFRVRPVLLLAVLAGAVSALVLPAPTVREVVLPLLFGVLSIALAEVPTREREAGLSTIVASTPVGARRPAAWKLASGATVALVVCGVPLARLAASEPASSLQALAGVLFLAAAAVAVGIAAGTPRVFMAGSMALWYVALNADGRPPAVDYGGWAGVATPATIAGWLAAAAVSSLLALAAQRARGDAWTA
jgi:hypothetical protein